VDGRQQLDTVMPALVTLVKGVQTEQLDAPTPCSEWSVRDLLGHLVGGGHMFAGAFRADPSSSMDAAGDPIGDREPADALQHAIDDFTSAIAEPGAAERMVTLPFGQMPGEAVMRLVAADLLIHGWDLATATGQRWEPDQALAAEALAFERQAVQPAMRGEAGSGMPFGPEQQAAPGAGPLQQLVAFAGRTP
jgi:uncharacterized protein (TIGR03086 family)